MNQIVEKLGWKKCLFLNWLARFFAFLLVGLTVATTGYADEKPTSVSKKGVITGLIFIPEGDRLRLVLEMTKAVKPATQILTAPNRYVIDLASTTMKLTNNKALGKPGFVAKINRGDIGESSFRLVLTMARPFIQREVFSVPATSANYGRHRLVFDFEAVSQKRMGIFLAKQAEEARLKVVRAAEEKAKREAKKTLPKGRRKWRVVLDPGHGGKDGGAKTVAGKLEKDIVLDFAKRLKAELEKSDLFQVILTRNGDTFVPLVERVKIARASRADLFISIHADSLPKDRRVRGTAVYTISDKASDKLAEELANQQNKVDVLAGYELKNAPKEVESILFDLTRQQTSNLSSLFARHFVRDLKGKITFFKFPVQRAAFTVLRIPEIPSALIELGFLSNAKDAEQLSSEAWREKTSKFMAKSIISYFAKPFLARQPNQVPSDG